jgi:hypothetical protein
LTQTARATERGDPRDLSDHLVHRLIAAMPMTDDLHMLGVINDLDDNPFEQQTYNFLSFFLCGGCRLPKRGEILGKVTDRLKFSAARCLQTFALETVIINHEARLGCQRLFPTLLEGPSNQSVLWLDTGVTAPGAIDLELGALKTLLPLTIERFAFCCFKVTSDRKTDLECGRFQRLEDNARHFLVIR